MDARITLPDEWNLAPLSHQGLRFFATMRSRRSLTQLTKLAKIARTEQRPSGAALILPIGDVEGAGADAGMDVGKDDETIAGSDDGTIEETDAGADAGTDAGTDAGMASVVSMVDLAWSIQRLEDQELVSSLITRFYEMSLFQAMELDRSADPVRAAEDFSSMREDSGCDNDMVKHHTLMGKKTFLLCGGHIGLAALMPLNAHGELDHRQELGLEEAMAIGALFHDDWTRKMCSLGQDLSYILKDNETRELPLDRVASDMQWAVMSEWDGVVDKWAKYPCRCDDD